MFERLAAHRAPLLALSVVVAMLAVALAIRLSGGDLPIIATTLGKTGNTQAQQQDSDGDGAPDWQESLLGTDPFDASSSPDDESIIVGGATATSSSVTEQFARSYIYQYLSASGGAQRPVSNPEQIGAQVASSLRAPLPEFTPYTADSLKTGGTSAAAQKAYYAALEKALAPLKRVTEPELLVYSRVIGEEGGARAQMEGIIANYRSAASAVMQVSTPANATSVHLSAANALLYYAAILEQLLHYTDDPVGSLTLLASYNEAESAVFTAFDNLRNYFALYSISS